LRAYLGRRTIWPVPRLTSVRKKPPMPMSTRILRALALILTVAFAHPSVTYPGVCEPDSFDARFARSKWVFHSKVLRIVKPKPTWRVAHGESTAVWPQAAMIRYDLRTTEAWKGTMQPRMTIYSPGVDSACGVDFKVGTEYLIFASDIDSPRWIEWPDGVRFPATVTTTLDGTRPVAEAKGDLARLGSPTWVTWEKPPIEPNPDPWTVFVQTYGGACREFSDSAAIGWAPPGPSSGTPRLLHRNNWPGKALPLDGWPKESGSWAAAKASSSLGMYTIEIDSCWSETRIAMRSGRSGPVPDTLSDRLCVPVVAIFDTTGLRRATFPNARGPAWSPDGRKVAFRTLQRPTYRTEFGTRNYPELPTGVTILSPVTGESWSYPAASDYLAWASDEALMLEFRGRRYGLSWETGQTGTRMFKAAEPTIMLGVPSPDEWYVYRPGTLKLWSLFGRETDIIGAKVDSTIDAPEGLDTDVAYKLIEAIGSKPDDVSKDSFWVPGEEHAHDLCIGVGWRGERRGKEPRSSRCEVLVIDVHRAVVARRFAGALIGPADGGRSVVIWEAGRAVFETL
jgi:hypothetical protein